MSRNHRLIEREAVFPDEFGDKIFIGGSNKAAVLGVVTEAYSRRSGVHIELDHCVDNVVKAMSLVASTGGLALMPAYAKKLMPPSVVSRPLEARSPRSTQPWATPGRTPLRFSSDSFLRSLDDDPCTRISAPRRRGKAGAVRLQRQGPLELDGAPGASSSAKTPGDSWPGDRATWA
jgi:hypothetical protein